MSSDNLSVNLCEYCDDTGVVTCGACDGSGCSRSGRRPDDAGSLRLGRVCPDCLGRGFIECEECDGPEIISRPGF